MRCEGHVNLKVYNGQMYEIGYISTTVIILCNFGYNIFSGFRSTEGRNPHCPIDYAGHRYNSAAATAQPVIHCSHTLLYATLGT